MTKEIFTTLMVLGVFVPLAGIPILLLARRSFSKYIALGFSLLPLLIGMGVNFMHALPGSPSLYENGFEIFSKSLWFSVPNIDVKFMLGMDGISSYMILLAALIFPILVLYSWGKVDKQEKLYYLMLLVMQTGILGFFLSVDLLVFYIFYEMVLIPAAFFIGIWGGVLREKAAMKFFLFTLAGSLIMMIGIIYLSLNAVNGVITTDYFVIQDAIANGGTINGAVRTMLFIAFAVSFIIKMPLFPLHTWQPFTYSESSFTGSVILAALLSKMGAYGLIRFGLGLFPEEAVAFAPYLGALAVITVIYGAYLAVMQTNIKRMIAYGSMSHMGFITLGIFAFNSEALSGAVLQMVAHGIATAALFLFAGMLYERHATKDIRSFRGVAKNKPVFALFFMIAVLAMVGLPGLSGFVGEFMILLGSFKSNILAGTYAVIAALSVILSAVYLINTFRRVMFGEAHESLQYKLTDLSRQEYAVALPLVIMMLVIGLYATPFLTQIDRGSEKVISQVDREIDVVPDASLTEGELDPLTDPALMELPPEAVQ